MVIQAIRRFTVKYPVTRGMITYAFLWPAANTTEHLIKGEEIDMSLALRFGLFGSMWVAPSLFLWVRFIGKVIPGQSVLIGVKKALLEQVIYSPFAVSSFIIGLDLLEGKNWKYTSAEWKQKFFSVWQTGFCYWPIVQSINFAYIAERNRVPFTAMFSFIWICFLSYVKRQKVVVDK